MQIHLTTKWKSSEERKMKTTITIAALITVISTASFAETKMEKIECYVPITTIEESSYVQGSYLEDFMSTSLHTEWYNNTMNYASKSYNTVASYTSNTYNTVSNYTSSSYNKIKDFTFDTLWGSETEQVEQE